MRMRQAASCTEPARPRRRQGGRPRRLARGASLVEWLVGSALGLVVVSAGLTVAGGHLAEQRRLQRELRLEQDLHAAAALLVRDLRRSGFWWHAPAAGAGPNPYAGWTLSGTASAPSLTTAWAHPQRSEDDILSPDERRGLRLRAGVLEVQLGQGNWQALTDINVLRVTSLRLTPREEVFTRSCPGTCRDSPTGEKPTCTARLVLRHLHIELQVRSARVPSLERQWQGELRLRNDDEQGHCGA
jgi:prepilin peptidase dependent protein B